MHHMMPLNPLSQYSLTIYHIQGITLQLNLNFVLNCCLIIQIGYIKNKNLKKEQNSFRV